MNALFRHLVASSLVASALLLAMACLGRRSASTRHAILVCAALNFALPVQWFLGLGAFLRTFIPAHPMQISVAADLHGMISPLTQGASIADETTLNVAFFSLWFAVATALLLIWLRKLLAPVKISGEVSAAAVLALERMKVRMRITRDVCLKSSTADFEPRLCGLFIPTIALPATLAEHLVAEELDAVLLHELAHVRRWDNLTRAAAHVLTCVFWFFPLLAWLERRIDAECELACDELVLTCGAQPDKYLSGILKVCRFHFLKPVAGSSSVSGSNLNRRMEYIMSSPITNESNVSAGIVAGSLFSCVATALILVGFLSSTPSRGQAAAGGAEKTQVTCRFNGAEYAEGTVIQLGKGSEQMCVQLRDHPLWVKTSDQARERSMKLVSLPLLPAPAPFLCTPTAPAGKYCTCKVQGKFSPGAAVHSEKGPLVCAASGGNWRLNTP